MDAAKQEVGLLEVKRQAILDGNVERSVAMAVLRPELLKDSADTREGPKVGLGTVAGGISLTLQHTRDWFVDELFFHGKTVDRQLGEVWSDAGATTAEELATIPS